MDKSKQFWVGLSVMFMGKTRVFIPESRIQAKAIWEWVIGNR
jgi:hypothetical protein